MKTSQSPYGLSVLELAAAEKLEVHRQCDRVNIAIEAHGERLSSSQRVTLLALAYDSLKEQLEARG